MQANAIPYTGPVRSTPITALLLVCAMVACAEAEGGRRGFLHSQISGADRTLIRTRPSLVEGKYDRMARSLYDFYRGSVPVFAADFRNGEEFASASAFREPVMVLSTGDAHPENFGLLLGADGVLALEPNDFDSADRYPASWDLRRLATGLVLAVRIATDETDGNRLARDVVVAMVDAYRTAVGEYAAGAPRERFDRARIGALVQEDGAVFDDLFRRGDRDTTRALEEAAASGVTLRRGPEAEDPSHLFQDLPPAAFEELPRVLASYRRGLLSPPDEAFFAIQDGVRELGSGVASWPRIRVLLRVRGPSEARDDDVLLELKELSDSAAAGWFLPQRYYNSVGERIQATSQALWARPDAEALWGHGMWLGAPVQVRLESDAQKTIRTRRLVDERATGGALRDLGRVLGRLLARMHAAPADLQRSGSTRSPAAALRDGLALENAAQQEAEFALRYADRVQSDFVLFRELVATGELLRLPRSPEDTPRSTLLELFGVPAPVPESL